MSKVRPWLLWIALIVTASLVHNVLDSRGGRWTAWTYADQTRLNPTLLGEFDTPEACRAAGLDDLRHRGLKTSGAVKCGRKCERRRAGDYYCAETRASWRPASWGTDVLEQTPVS